MDSKNEWISCSTKLPHPKKRVEICFERQMPLIGCQEDGCTSSIFTSLARYTDGKIGCICVKGHVEFFNKDKEIFWRLAPSKRGQEWNLKLL